MKETLKKDVIEIDGNCIIKDDNKYEFKHSIRTGIKTPDGIIVLLSIPFNDNTLNNIYFLDEQMNIKWKVEDIDKKYPQKNNLPYDQMSFMEGIIKATDFYGRCYSIDASNGKIIDMEIVK